MRPLFLSGKQAHILVIVDGTFIHDVSSLGNSCIYVIGGTTQDTEPVPLALHSGDIVVMTKPCRKFFHGKSSIALSLMAFLSTPSYHRSTADNRGYITRVLVSTTT